MKKTARTQLTHNWANVLLMAVCFPVACGMYYFHKDYIGVGGIDIMYKFVLSLLIVALSFVVFLIRTDLTRAKRLLESIGLLSLPHFVMILASVPIWVFQIQRMDVIRRGVFSELYIFIIVIAVGGLLYIFGQQGFWFNLAAMLAANLITAVRVILENGFSVYLEELRTLIVTFANETGPVIHEMEVHELTFGLGVCLTYGILNWKEFRQHREGPVFLALTLFLCLSGFKRIGAVAIGVALGVWIILRPLSRRRSGPVWLMMVACGLIVLEFLYICLVHGGIYDFLSDNFGLNTMGRRELSRFINQYYWIGPDYLGNGVGFVSRLFSDMGSVLRIRALHNDVLQIYVDAGFWGFWVWMLCYLPLRVWSAYRWHGQRSALICLCLEAFVLITAMTDNTLYYVYVTGALSICLMSDWLKEWETETCSS